MTDFRHCLPAPQMPDICTASGRQDDATALILSPLMESTLNTTGLFDGELLPPEQLPRFSPAWVYRRTRRRVQSVVANDGAPGRMLYRGQLYVATFDRAISGAKGHTTTLRSAFKILRFAGFDEALAWQLMLFYNATRCDPPWSEKDLKRKLTEALRLSSR